MFRNNFRDANSRARVVVDATFGLASSEMGVVRAQIRFRSDISPLESVGRSFPARLTDPLASTWSVSTLAFAHI